MQRVLVANRDMSSRHCRMHGKDFSDCIVYHFNWQNKCASRRNAFVAIIREALQGRWGIPVQLRPYDTSGDAPENRDEDESVPERYNEGAGVEAEISSTPPPLAFRSQSGTYNARESEIFRYNGDKLDNDSAKALTHHGTSGVCEEDNNVQTVEGHPQFVARHTVREKILFANDACSSKMAAKSCGYPEAEACDHEHETSTWSSRLNSHHDDRTFSRTEQKKRKWEFIGDGIDPLEAIGEDLMLNVFSNLDALSLARCGAVSKNWLTLAGRDDLWQHQCDIFWENKAHFPFDALRKGLTKMEAYSITVAESKRTKITRKDLCDHVWEFRFKEVAPDYWLSLDPSWQGQAPMKRYFHADGSQTAGSNDPVWGGHECKYYLIDIPPSKEKSIRYIRINHWPMMSVSRTENWGWELSNEIYVYNSVPE